MEKELIVQGAQKLSEQAEGLSQNAALLANQAAQLAQGEPAQSMFVMFLTVFVLAVFVGYYVVWRVTPALHSPLMAVTNAVSSVIVVGAMLAAGLDEWGASKVFGFLAVVLASVNIFGGFIVTQRMLAMFKKKQK